MVKENKEKTYWPHMIVGFLLIGITLGYWTVKHATSLPVQEENEYMLKYQKADMNINEILEKQKAFDKKYKIIISDVEMLPVKKNEVLHRKQKSQVKLAKGENTFSYEVVNVKNADVPDANVSFLLTRPHTKVDDIMIETVPFSDGKYRVTVSVEKPGRYVLRIRARIGDAVGYSDTPAYLKP
ncbi:hypothetical protein YH65_10135 [Sulfurovum lithotrophicum]|uniref:YtkA-like domain-containing protein n=1 Tax=Sulfurovum lithotrophicum TaxID=206403 RepID=A0A7U4RRD4_9BACT|nr:FixH family protein [Sulfurovum lithotrophicum]AKF25702.1 hypothetical protein YH65_10135 [Sulfurovum lithotrophicum]